MTETLADKLSRYTDRSGGPDACWPWLGAKDTRGYGRVWFAGKVRCAHRLAFSEHAGQDAVNFVCHRCDTPACCNPAHLFDGTQDDNMQDCRAKGRHRTPFPLQEHRGEAHSNSILTAETVLAIRADPRSTRVIAKLYGLKQQHISKIKRRILWAHIPPQNGVTFGKLGTT